jgi:hypothetical protein
MAQQLPEPVQFYNLLNRHRFTFSLVIIFKQEQALPEASKSSL